MHLSFLKPNAEIKMKVAVVILNWNGKDWLEKFLPSVVKYSTPLARIVVADNASNDDSLAFLDQNYPEIIQIKNPENGGYAKGYNQALAQLDDDYFVLLNSDVEVEENWLAPMIELMEKDTSIAACQPKILSYHEKDTFEYAGAAGGYLDRYGYPFCRGRIFNHLEKDNGQYNDTREIVWATGAAMCVRASDFHNEAGFDDYFFAHHEEIDLCWRWINKGKRIMYCGDATVYHVGGGTLQTGSAFKTYLNYRNSLFVLLKNLPSSKRYARIFTRMVLDGVSAIQLLLSGKPSLSFAILKAHVGFYKAFGAMRKKATATKNLPPQLYHKSIVFGYFLKKHKEFTQLVFSTKK